MRTVALGGWDDLAAAIAELRRQHPRAPGERPLLFRGESAGAWPLTATLERRQGDILLRDYLRRARRCVWACESFTGRRWQAPPPDELERSIDALPRPLLTTLPLFEFLVYLRHHGFPSPLLDWTASPWIAAHFAFAAPGPEPEVAIYALVDPGPGGGDGSRMSVLAEGVSGEGRHHLQQAIYSIATAVEDGEHRLAPHARALEGGDLVKFTLPAAERDHALAVLHDFTITPFALFRTEDALVESLAIAEFDLARPGFAPPL